MGKTKVGTCRLCQAENVKLKKSHIISKFFYRDVFGCEANRPYQVHAAHQGSFKGQGGEWEHMLCDTCENNIGGFERLTAQYMRKESARWDLHRIQKDSPHSFLLGVRQSEDTGVAFWQVTDYDYIAWKKCMLAQLFRAHHAKRGLFEAVNLDIADNAALRQYLLDKIEDREEFFPVMIFALDAPINGDTDISYSSVIGQPVPTELDGHPVYRFVLMGFILFIFVGMANLKESGMERFLLKPNKSLFPSFDHHNNTNLYEDLFEEMTSIVGEGDR